MPPQPFVIEERVRWSDVDHAGIIFYGSYVRFFEIAETELFRKAGLPYSEVFERFDVCHVDSGPLAGAGSDLRGASTGRRRRELIPANPVRSASIGRLRQERDGGRR